MKISDSLFLSLCRSVVTWSPPSLWVYSSLLPFPLLLPNPSAVWPSRTSSSSSLISRTSVSRSKTSISLSFSSPSASKVGHGKQYSEADRGWKCFWWACLVWQMGAFCNQSSVFKVFERKQARAQLTSYPVDEKTVWLTPVGMITVLLANL